MRTVLITTAALLVMCLINTVTISTANGGNYAGYTAYAAPACAAPAYCGPLEPGCCEYPPSCRCDDIWAGYCQEKNQGCGFPLIRIPVIAGPCRKSYCHPRVAPARCGPTCEPTCTEPACNQPLVPSQGKSTKPAPAIKPAPKATPKAAPKATPVKSTKLTPPAKPQPDKEKAKAASTRKSSGAWRFMPASRSLAR